MQQYPTTPGDSRPPFEPRVLVVISADGLVYMPVALTEGEAAACAELAAAVRPALEAFAAQLLRGREVTAA